MRPILAQTERLIPKPIIQITELRRCTIILIHMIFIGMIWPSPR